MSRRRLRSKKGGEIVEFSMTHLAKLEEEKLMSIHLTSTQREQDTDMARARHYYAGSVPEEIAKAVRLEWERDETNVDSEADRMEVLEIMIACAIRVAVEEGISNG